MRKRTSIPSDRPPRWAERWLQRAAQEGATGDSLAGDLWQEWSELAATRGRGYADRWYVRQVIALSGRLRLGRMLDRSAAAPEVLARDLGAGVRGLRRTPGFTTIATLSLAGGLGLTTVAFALVNALLFAPLPWPEAPRLVDLDMQHPLEVCAGCSGGVSLLALEAWSGVEGVEAVAAIEGSSARMAPDANGAAEQVFVTAVTSEVAHLLGASPTVGRLFTDDEFANESHDPAVLSHSFWARRYGADPGVVGRSLRLDETTYEIVGVLSPEVRPLDRGDVWVPLPPTTASSTLDERSLWAFARLAPGVDLRRVAESLTAIHNGLARDVPDVDEAWTVAVTPMRNALLGEIGDPAFAWLLFAAAGGVLLIACLNLASLLLARVADRAPELRLRRALGAGTGSLARLVLVEASIVASVGVVLSMALAGTLRSLALGSLGGALPRWVAVPIDVRVWGVGVGGAALAVVACALVPALRAARVDGSWSSAHNLTTPETASRRRWLLGGQIAIGVALVSSTAAATDTARRVSDFDGLGHRWERIIGLRVAAAGETTGGATHDQVMSSLTSLPPVTDVSAEARAFLGSWGAADGPSPMRILGRPDPVPDRIVPRHSLAVTPGYFALFDIPIEEGRELVAGDASGRPAVAVVSREAARVLWPNESPLGEQFVVDNGVIDGPVTVVGVSGDVVVNPLSQSRRPSARIYFSLDQASVTDVTYRVAYEGASPTRTELVQQLAEADPTAPVLEVTTVRQELNRWIAPVTISATVMAGLGMLATTLLALGVFGALSVHIAARGREIGVRRALGAPSGRLVLDAARAVARIVFAGLVVGALLSGLAGGLLRSGFVQIGATEPSVLLSAVTFVALAAVAASAGPLRRALRVDPNEILRAE